MELVETKVVRMEFARGVASLTITSLEPAHEGTYECAAQSYAGSAGATASVSVKGRYPVSQGANLSQRLTDKIWIYRRAGNRMKVSSAHDRAFHM